MGLLSILVPILFLAGCPTTEPEAPSDAPGINAAKGESFAPETSERPLRDLDPTSLRNMSELLAGVVPDPDEGQLDPVWAQHAEAMGKAWTKIDQRLSKMRAWTDTELAGVGNPEAPLVYPFGGPDLVSAIQFFPEASIFILLGLEAPGLLPLPEDFSGEALAEDLERLRRPFQSMVESGYFVRSEIHEDLSGGHFDGLLPLLLVGLIHADQIPIRVDYVAIDPETYQVTSLPPDITDASAVKITLVSRDEADRMDAAARSGEPIPEAEKVRPRSVYYFAQDLSNKGLYTDDPFSRLIERQESINVYIKGGEYLLHRPSFSNLRELLLAKTSLLLQDDSGLPVRHLKSDRWTLRLYGKYSNVLAAYKKWFQEDLAAAFAKGKNIGALDFNLGYNSTTDGGCLILAQRLPEEDESEDPGTDDPTAKANAVKANEAKANSAAEVTGAMDGNEPEKVADPSGH